MADERSNFVAVRLSDEEVARLEEVMDLLEPVTGKRTTSDAIRYIIRHFDLETSPLGKDYALGPVAA